MEISLRVLDGRAFGGKFSGADLDWLPAPHIAILRQARGMSNAIVDFPASALPDVTGALQ